MKTSQIYIFVIISLIGLVFSCRIDRPIPDEDYEPITNPNATAYQLPNLPFFPPMPIPENNPLTNESVELGKFLFYDKKLSGDNTQSCAECHFQVNSFADPNQFSTGITGAIGNRQGMACVNLAWAEDYFWDGRAKTLEEQVVGPVENPIEMNEDWDALLIELAQTSMYPPLYEAAFGSTTITKDRTARALASFLRTLVSYRSKFDRQRIGEYEFTDSEERGYLLFLTEPEDININPDPEGGGDCFHCHPLGLMQFTDYLPHNNGLDSVFTDLGVGGITGDPMDMGVFKVPSLRNIELTSPYMHDGRFTTLEEVVDHYNTGGKESPTIDALMKYTNGGLHLTDQDKEDLIAFLKCFTDTSFINNPEHSNPF